MSRRPFGPYKVWLLLASMLFFAFLAGAANVAFAQTSSPKLGFLNGTITTRAEPGGKDALQYCPQGHDAYVETATATVFVLLSSTTEGLTNIEFVPEVQSVASAREASTSYDQIVDRNQIRVQWRAAESNQQDSTIQPSEVKPFNLRILICSDSKPPGWRHYAGPNNVPAAWSNLAGHLIVRDSVNEAATAGTVSMQLNRPSLGYEQTYFVVIALIAILAALALTVWMNVGIDDVRKLKLSHPVDFKTTYAAPLTTAAAVLGTIATATILPADTFFMSKGQYAALNALFGLAVVFAAAVHNNLDRAGSFLGAAGVTLGAAVGEGITVWFVLKEMGLQGSLPSQIVWVFQVLLLIIGVVLIINGRKSVVNEINKKQLRFWP